MSDQDETSTDRSVAPFLGALVIIVVVITGIFLFNRHSGDGGDPEQIGNAVSGQNDALQRQSYPDFVGYTCAAQHGKQEDVLARQRDSVAKRGERYVDGVGNVVVDGDRATTKVTYHFKDAPDALVTVDMTLVREDGAWKVCAAGPA